MAERPVYSTYEFYSSTTMDRGRVQEFLDSYEGHLGLEDEGTK